MSDSTQHTAIWLAQKAMSPCPFCSESTIKIDSHPAFYAENLEHHYAECANCHSRGPEARSALEAIDGWNRRVQP